ncbi:hypothetical protein CCP3SC1_2080002 [Gammaproteobacteria bacterium]
MESVKANATLAERQTVPLSPANRAAALLANGGAVAEALQTMGIANSGSDTASQTLFAVLASGTSPDVALAEAVGSAITQTAVTIAQAVPMSKSEQLIATLASGTNSATSVDSTLLAALSSGVSPDAALLVATQATTISKVLAEAQSVQVLSTNQLIETLSKPESASQLSAERKPEQSP